MKRRVVAILLAVTSIFLCACTKECTCNCGCAECTCSKASSQGEDSKKDSKEKTLESYAEGVEYKGTLRKEGVFIGTIAEDGKTMRVSHRGGIWNMDYVDGVKEHESLWAVIADNDTPEDYTDDTFISFILEE